MRRIKKNIFLSLVLGLNSYVSNSQLYTGNNYTVEELVTQYFAGNTTISNIHYVGDPQAIGSYDARLANLGGFGQGIVLSTGTILDTDRKGPRGPNDSITSNAQNSGIATDLFDYVLGTNIKEDAAILKFDFIADSDSFYVDYIFGSEEYMEYVGAGFNDICGIFISGPGITGIKNIATLGSQAKICVDYINADFNSLFYVDNGNGITAPYNTDEQYIRYDGMTTPFRASISGLTIGETYHLKFAIVDAGDDILDSGLFLSKNSFGFDEVRELSEGNQFQIVPNPGSGMISIKGAHSDLITSIEIRDELGRLVKTFSKNNLSMNLDLSDCSTGIYHLIISGQHINEIQKIQLSTQKPGVCFRLLCA